MVHTSLADRCPPVETERLILLGPRRSAARDRPLFLGPILMGVTPLCVHSFV